MSYFFFQAEDGIRDIGVTGVQTCALPISRPDLPQAFAAGRLQPVPPRRHRGVHGRRARRAAMISRRGVILGAAAFPSIVRAASVARLRTVETGLGRLRGTIERSEERRVGKEG